MSKLAISMANSSGAIEIMEGLIVLAEWDLAIEQNWWEEEEQAKHNKHVSRTTNTLPFYRGEMQVLETFLVAIHSTF